MMPRFNHGFSKYLNLFDWASFLAKLSGDFEGENFKKISGSWQRPLNGRSTGAQRTGGTWAQCGRKAGAGNRLVPLAFWAWATQARRSGDARKALDLINAAKATGKVIKWRTLPLDPAGERTYRDHKLGTFGAPSEVRRIDPAEYLAEKARGL